MTDWLQYFTQLASLVLIPAFAGYVTYRTLRAKEKQAEEANDRARDERLRAEQFQFRNDIHLEVEKLRERNLLLQEKNEKLVREISELTGKFLALEANLNFKIALFESAHQDLPLPMWLKDEKGQVLAINKEYESIFLLPRGYSMENYLGHDDFSVWPPEVAEEFRANDARVYATGETWVGTENVPDKEGTPIPWRIVKYVRWAGPIKLGIAGIAVPEMGYELRT